MAMIVKVNDGFVEWAFEFEDTEASYEYSIQDMIDAITEKTGLVVGKSYICKELQAALQNPIRRLIYWLRGRHTDI